MELTPVGASVRLLSLGTRDCVELHETLVALLREFKGPASTFGATSANRPSRSPTARIARIAPSLNEVFLVEIVVAACLLSSG